MAIRDWPKGRGKSIVRCAVRPAARRELEHRQMRSLMEIDARELERSGLGF